MFLGNVRTQIIDTKFVRRTMLEYFSASCFHSKLLNGFVSENKVSNLLLFQILFATFGKTAKNLDTLYSLVLSDT